MTGAIIQARTSSTRLPAKVLKELPFGSGISALAQVIRRVKRSQKIDQVIVATTVDDNDDSIVSIAGQEGVKCFRGSLDNVLERYFLAAEKYAVDTIVRITSDCPCIDPAIVEKVIERHFQENADYTSNAFIRSYPVGLDVEVLKFSVLEKAHLNADQDYQKEHVTPYVHDFPEHFKIVHVQAPEALKAPQRRITLDTPEDYAVLCAIFDDLYGQNSQFTASDIMNLYKRKPWIELINQKISAKKKCDTLDEEVKELIRIAKLQGYQRVSDLLEQKA